MAAKQSAAMDEALRLVAGGMAIRAAARQAGVWWTSLHAAIRREQQRELDRAERKPPPVIITTCGYAVLAAPIDRKKEQQK